MDLLGFLKDKWQCAPTKTQESLFKHSKTHFFLCGQTLELVAERGC